MKTFVAINKPLEAQMATDTPNEELHPYDLHQIQDEEEGRKGDAEAMTVFLPLAAIIILILAAAVGIGGFHIVRWVFHLFTSTAI